MKNKTLLTIALMAFAFTVSAQSIVNRLTTTVIEDSTGIIGFVPEHRFIGMASGNSPAAIGMINDYSVGNYLFFGNTEADINGNGRLPGIFYYPSYNQVEITSPVRFFNDVNLVKHKIGLFGGSIFGYIPVQGTPLSSTDSNEQLSNVCFDDNFVYIKTPSGRWKRLALMDINFSW